MGPPKDAPHTHPAHHQGRGQRGQGQQRWVCTTLDVQRKGTHMGLEDVGSSPWPPAPWVSLIQALPCIQDLQMLSEEVRNGKRIL